MIAGKPLPSHSSRSVWAGPLGPDAPAAQHSAEDTHATDPRSLFPGLVLFGELTTSHDAPLNESITV